MSRPGPGRHRPVVRAGAYAFGFAAAALLLLLLSNAVFWRRLNPGRADISWNEVRSFIFSDLRRFFLHSMPPPETSGLAPLSLSIGSESLGRLRAGAAGSIGIAVKSIAMVETHPPFQARVQRGSLFLGSSGPPAAVYSVTAEPSRFYRYEQLGLVKATGRFLGADAWLRGEIVRRCGGLAAVDTLYELRFNGRPSGVHLGISVPGEFFLRQAGRLPGNVYVPRPRDDATNGTEEVFWTKTAVLNVTPANDVADWSSLAPLLEAPEGFSRINGPALEAYVLACLLLPQEHYPEGPAWFVDPSSDLGSPILLSEIGPVPGDPERPLHDLLPPRLRGLFSNPAIERDLLLRVAGFISSDTQTSRLDADLAALQPSLTASALRDMARMTHQDGAWAFMSDEEAQDAVPAFREWLRRRVAFLRREIPARLRLLPPVARSRSETVTLSGVVTLSKTLVIPEHVTWVLSPGTVLKLDSGVSVLVLGRILSRGEPGRNVRFIASRPGVPWGVLALQGRAGGRHRLQGTLFENGSHATIRNVPYSGMVSAYNADADFEDCLMRANHESDDMFNAKNGDIRMVRCVFRDSLMDAADFDISSGRVDSCLFECTGNDGLDLMTSTLVVQNSRFIRCGDKGISVGEESTPRIDNCLFLENVIGTASKDGSEPVITNSTYLSCTTAIAVYEKNTRYLGPGGGVFRDNAFVRCPTPLTMSSEARIEWEGNVAGGNQAAEGPNDPPRHAFLPLSRDMAQRPYGGLVEAVRD